MITDLFSHKIHSSGDEWPEKLAELAAIFGEFDGQLYDRDSFERRLQRISPRASYFARDAAASPLTEGGRLDVSKFRDEISAYPAYLGLYFLQSSPSGWIVRVSETARRFLLCEEPDVAAFLRLQLPLFQYPNAMGAAYRSHTNNLRIQANARNRTLEFVNNGIHFSPLRLITMAMKADAELRGANVLQSSVSFDEIFALANVPEVNRHALPSLDTVVVTLDGIRRGRITAPVAYESRFHTLRHTEMFVLERRTVKLREGVNEVDRQQLRQQLDAICSIDNQFTAFDDCASGQDLEEVIASGEWGRYFDAVRMLPSKTVEALTSDEALQSEMAIGSSAEVPFVVPQPVAEIYPFRERNGNLMPIRPYSRRTELADPELTRIKKQKRNLAHKELVDKMDSWLRRIGAQPKENDHIDLYAKIPTDGSFIFEMKSGGDSILEQIRKGLSQLYEYRYRYQNVIADEHISLCLVLPESPSTIPWITDYLCEDRGIGICWFEEGGELVWPPQCTDRMEALRPVAAS